jgi:DNA topoisomerase-1
MPASSQHAPGLGELETCRAADPIETAKAAGLHYMSDAQPGIQRKRVGKHFSYIGLDGKPIRDPKELERIKKIGIPPAWKQVWISPSPKGRIQATGEDSEALPGSTRA